MPRIISAVFVVISVVSICFITGWNFTSAFKANKNPVTASEASGTSKEVNTKNSTEQKQPSNELQNSSTSSFANIPPVVKILVDKGQPDLETGSPGIITLDGTQSYDPDGKILPESYLWTVINGSAINLTSNWNPVQKFKTNTNYTSITFELTVRDDLGAITSKNIEVNPVFPQESIR